MTYLIKSNSVKIFSFLKTISQLILWVGILFFSFFQVQWIDYVLDDNARVFDRAEVISEEIEISIDDQLLWLENTTLWQIVFVTLPNLEWRTIEEVALRFWRENWIGDGDRNTWLVVLVAIQERQWRIEVWYGLEWFITDLQANRLGLDILVPAFRAWEYGLGLQALSSEIVDVLSWEKELEHIEQSNQSIQWVTVFDIFVFGVFAAFFLWWMVSSWKPNANTKVITSWVGSVLTGLAAMLLATGRWVLIAVPLYFIRKIALNSEWKRWSWWGLGSWWFGWGWSFSGWWFGGFGWWSFGWGWAGWSR